ncbi:alcohol dehydrogenase catalytic domain-containing protein [Agrococcus terreus]|uniref:alcohol dehydrogenase catalytic domain-containing protein n=1 Tax=Agrococcus terreus TaxID=574649 RepID=UPI00384E421B
MRDTMPTHTMQAVRYTTFGERPELVEIERPEPGPGEVLLRITASGLCHSDEVVMSFPEEGYPYPMPMTLGHEPAGVVEALGEGATGVEVGDAVIVYGCWGCGVCAMCASGREQLCLRGMVSPGLGRDGAMAEYMVVDTARHLVPIGDLDPVRAASLTDAALTPYEAIKKVLPHLTGGSTAVVIGAGGLGHVAIQLLRQLTSAKVIALDVGEEKLAFAREMGAHETVESNADAAARVRELTDGIGAEVVLDFVGIDATGATAMAAVQVGAPWCASARAADPRRSGCSPRRTTSRCAPRCGARARRCSSSSGWRSAARSASRRRRTRSRRHCRRTPTSTTGRCAGARSSCRDSRWRPRHAAQHGGGCGPRIRADR